LRKSDNDGNGHALTVEGQKMTKKTLKEANAASQNEPSVLHTNALTRWDDEGGRLLDDTASLDAASEIRLLTNAELVQLRIRMIALENVVIALLSSTSDPKLELARDMAAYILPRPGFIQHPLTIHAATQMLHLVHRAAVFRDVGPLESALPRQADE
jgi:hypothetical protein